MKLSYAALSVLSVISPRTNASFEHRDDVDLTSLLFGDVESWIFDDGQEEEDDDHPHQELSVTPVTHSTSTSSSLNELLVIEPEIEEEKVTKKRKLTTNDMGKISKNRPSLVGTKGELRERIAELEKRILELETENAALDFQRRPFQTLAAELKRLQAQNDEMTRKVSLVALTARGIFDDESLKYHKTIQLHRLENVLYPTVNEDHPLVPSPGPWAPEDISRMSPVDRIFLMNIFIRQFLLIGVTESPNDDVVHGWLMEFRESIRLTNQDGAYPTTISMVARFFAYLRSLKCMDELMYYQLRFVNTQRQSHTIGSFLRSFEREGGKINAFTTQEKISSWYDRIILEGAPIPMGRVSPDIARYIVCMPDENYLDILKNIKQNLYQILYSLRGRNPGGAPIDGALNNAVVSIEEASPSNTPTEH